MVRNQSKERGRVIFLVRGSILQKGFFGNFGHEGVTGYYDFVIIIVITFKIYVIKKLIFNRISKLITIISS